MALYVATSKAQIYARQIVEHFGLAKYFERVFGAQLDRTRSDKTELLRFVLVEIGETAPATYRSPMRCRLRTSPHVAGSIDATGSPGGAWPAEESGAGAWAELSAEVSGPAVSD